MAKFKMKMKLQGFELDIEGERDDIPMIAQNIGEQFAGLLDPAANIAEGESPRKIVPNTAAPSPAVEAKPARKRKRQSGGSRNGAGATPDVSSVLNWEPKPEKWGNPLQAWNTAEKAIWLLYVAEQELGKTALPAAQIVATFNHHFKQSKTVHPPNVSRDLGKLKIGANSEVGEDSTKSPSEWFLTTAGKARAELLVTAALGKSEAATS